MTLQPGIGSKVVVSLPRPLELAPYSPLTLLTLCLFFLRSVLCFVFLALADLVGRAYVKSGRVVQAGRGESGERRELEVQSPNMIKQRTANTKATARSRVRRTTKEPEEHSNLELKEKL